MIQRYSTRSMAAKAAMKAGLRNFRTLPDRIERGMWRYHQMPGTSPAADWATGKDFVHHVETDFVDGGRSPGHVGVLVITCTLEEIANENVPADFRVEPITPSLFKPDAPDTGRARGESTGAAEGSFTRAKSDVASPSKLVWEMADKMTAAGSTRNEVIEACVAAGVNKATASTQFYRWAKAQKG